MVRSAWGGAPIPRDVPWALRKVDTGSPQDGDEPVQEDRVRASDAPDERILCAACGHEITSADARLTKAGRHQHTCVNPSGYVYRILCFRRAPGCVGTGSWSSFYSWFQGYAWQIACCGSCSMHLGWAFDPDAAPEDAEPFWGLIADRIAEPPRQQST